MLVVLLALAHSTVGVKPRRLPTGYVGLSPTACVRRFRYSGESEPVGLRLLPPRSAAWSTATSFSATHVVLRRHASPRDL